MKKVVFIDHGNMLRSPIAKAIYNQLAKDGSLAYSYGTHVIEQGYQGKKLSSFGKLETEINEMKKYGLDISNESCEQLKEEYLKDADKIIIMLEKEFIPEWLNNYKYEYWEIPNPEVHTSQIIEDIIKLIKGKVLELIEKQKWN